MTRAGFMVSVAVHLAYIADNYLAFGPSLARAMLPYELLPLCASLAAIAISFSPSYGRCWKYVTFGVCVSLMAGWTGADVLSKQQVEEAFGLAALLVATCVLCPWEPRWQVFLAIVALFSFSLNTALIRPMGRHLGYLWTDLLAIVGLTVVSSRLWARWRKALAESDAHKRKMLDAQMDSVTLIRLSDGRLLYVNEAFLKRGYKREEVLGKSIEELRVREAADLRELAAKIRAEGSILNHETTFRMPDGRIVPHLLSMVLIEVDGAPCVLSVARDITEIKQTQNELIAAQRRQEQSETKLRKIFEACPDTICVNSLRDGRLIEANPSFSRSGYSRDEVLNKPTGAGPGDNIWASPERFLKFASELVVSGTVHNMEADFRHRDGTIVPCLISGAVVELDGEPCAVTFTSDISQLKSAQAELVRAREAALSASRAKSEFLSSMSHEIRTPMNAILGMADLLAESTLTDEQRRFVETMVSNGSALLDLINGILDLARIESGRLNLEETDFELADLVELAIETFAARAHEKGLELLFRIMPEVPTNLVGDPLRLRQILVNLVGNAIKFTEHGEVMLTVENDTDAGGRVAVRFSVRDTGIGISSEQLGSVFQNFTQADSSTTRKFGGSGLGLAIARRLTELMNGRIWVESEAGKGSTFHFTATFSPGEHAIVDVQTPDLTGLRVLIVDDNADGRLILHEIISRSGAQVREAVCGKDALAEVEGARNIGKPYGLVLLDCAMPGMDGFRVAERLKRDSRSPQPVVLMLTSDDMSHKLARVREIGIGAYVVKPVKRFDLFSAIASVMGTANTVRTKRATLRAPARASRARALKILLVEDSPDNRLLIESYLKNLPYALDVAENGAVAIEKFLRNAYDLVLMDMQMPVMDGLTATRRIRQWEQERGRKSTPIVALTASAFEENVQQTLEAGCTAHVNKPVKKTTLLAVIHELTDATTASPSNGRAPSEHSA